MYWFKKFSLPFQQAFQGVQMLVECVSSQSGNGIAGVGFLAHKLLFHGEVFGFFQCSNMTGNVSIAGVEHFLEGEKVNRIVDHQHRHNAESNSAFESLVQFCDEMLHYFLSYFKYIEMP